MASADHLSTELIQNYRQRQLEPAQLLALDDHVMACPACREMLREITPSRDALISLRASLETDSENPSTGTSVSK
jgi:hypothetical protein